MLLFSKLIGQFFLDIFYFPIWWYSLGSKRVLSACFRMIEEGNSNLSPGLWLKNIFVPMFGQHDLQGRIMSFFMRLVNVIGRGFGLMVWIGIVFFLFLLWLFVPAFVLFQIVNSLFLL